MAIEYYVKRRTSKQANWIILETCPTPENARRQMLLYNDRKTKAEWEYAVFYSPDAILAFQKRRSA